MHAKQDNIQFLIKIQLILNIQKAQEINNINNSIF